MDDRFKSHILGELSKLAKRKVSRNSAMVVCPFHNDRSPSGGVNLDETERKAPLGWFRCFGCKTSVPWNNYAEAAGLQTFKCAAKKKSSDYLDPKRVADELLDEDDTTNPFDYELSKLKFKKRFPFDTWREVKVPLLEKLGCRYVYSEYFEEYYVWMPVNVQGVLRGYVKARIEKPKNKQPSYVNAKGNWAAKYGLLFFDAAVSMMKRRKLKTLVLCEGPRDALRLLGLGIPACAVLGASNWDDDKRFILETLVSLERVIVFMDGDDAGIEATKLIKKNLRGHFDVKHVSLWKYRVPKLCPKTGRQAFKVLGPSKVKKLLWENELDPFTAPKSILKIVKQALV